LTNRADAFLDHLDGISGRREARLLPIPSTRDGVGGVTVIVYDHVPEPGMSTGITYGLSLVDHPLWQRTRPELCLTVATIDDMWMLAVGELAERLRGQYAFAYGSTVDIGQTITGESDMTGFAVFAPAVLRPADAVDIEVGPDDRVTIVGVYPIHESERRFIADHGPEEFWNLGWDPFDVTRGAMV